MLCSVEDYLFIVFFFIYLLQVTSGKPPIKRKRLNQLLGYTVNRLKEKVNVWNIILL